MEIKTMKTLMIISLGLLTLALTGCDNEKTVLVSEDVYPATPQGVFSVTGDGAVWVYWNGIYEQDVNYYTVYRSLSETTGYTAIANVDAEPNPNLDLLIYEYIDNAAVNGVMYWYAVTAVDHAGQESELSAENVFDTPRPDGMSILLPNDIDSASSGFNLAAHQTVAWNSPLADIWVDRVVEASESDTTVYAYLNAGLFTDGITDIQDMGYTASFDDITWAPDDGWSQLGYAEALRFHTYVIWTADDHYAKVRITDITPSGTIAFEWAYQTAVNNYELAPPARPDRDRSEPQPKPAVHAQLLK
jgi:hypothetical protein